MPLRGYLDPGSQAVPAAAPDGGQVDLSAAWCGIGASAQRPADAAAPPPGLSCVWPSAQFCNILDGLAQQLDTGGKVWYSLVA